MKGKKEVNSVTFLGKVIYFLRSAYDKVKSLRLITKLSEREKRLAGYAGNAPTENSRAAYLFGVFKIIFATLFITLTLAILFFCGRIISYDNVYYMFKDIGYISSFNESRPDALNYSKPVSNQYFEVYKNGLAVTGDSEIKFFTPTGRVTLDIGSEFVNPIISCSDESALIYDGGRNSFAIYNSFVELYSEKLEYPISFAKMAKDGSFVVVTKSKKYPSVIRMYDSDFTLVREYFKNDYVISVDISDNGKNLSILSLDAISGESVVTLTVMKLATGRISSTVMLHGVMPYQCSFVDNDSVALVLDNKIAIYDVRGNKKSEREYSSNLSSIYTTDDKVVISFSGDGLEKSNTVVIYDDNCKTIFTKKVDGRIIDATLAGNYLYVLLEQEILEIDIKIGTVTRFETYMGAKKLLALSGGDVIICTESAAYYLNSK